MSDSPDPVQPALRIGDLAPSFTARSTAGEVRLADYRGRWLLLFSHPADFTPVCTSEFVALAHAEPRFAELNCELMALSVDSLYAHFAWVRAIRDRFGVEVRFPIVEDPTLVVGRAYGMVGAAALDSATMRSTFFIDPNGIVRAMSCYPTTVGRSVEELLRTLAALQAVDREGALAPEGWQPGDAMLRQPKPNLESVFAGGDPAAWFLSEAAAGA
jgi:peroxiredoxin (alkyl hydroperoxide reductase subunit C)